MAIVRNPHAPRSPWPYQLQDHPGPINKHVWIMTTPMSGVVRKFVEVHMGCLSADWLILQPGFTLRALCSSAPMGAPGALLMFASPCWPVQDGARRRSPLADQRPQQASDLGHGERQQFGGEVHQVHTPRSRPFGWRRDRRERTLLG